jgi:pilus assembly protein TadC
VLEHLERLLGLEGEVVVAGIDTDVCVGVVAELVQVAVELTDVLAQITEKLGVPVAQTLQVQAGELRTKRRQYAEEQAQKIPVKMLFPMMIFILPCLFLVVLGPAAINIMDALGS